MSSPAYSPDAGVHQQSQVVADLLGRDAELGGDLVDRDAAVPCRYGTSASIRTTCCCDRVMPITVPLAAACEALDDGVATDVGRDHHDVGAVGRDLGGELPVAMSSESRPRRGRRRSG